MLAVNVRYLSEVFIKMFTINVRMYISIQIRTVDPPQFNGFIGSTNVRYLKMNVKQQKYDGTEDELQ